MKKITEKQLSVIKSNIVNNKELLKRINTAYYGDNEEILLNYFLRDCNNWLTAIENRSMLCVVKSVSKSGMSRNFHYTSFQGSNFRVYSCFLSALGYKLAKNNRDEITVSGCGMDMNFNTNYNICSILYKLGYTIADSLKQSTPSIV